MIKNITCFLTAGLEADLKTTVKQLQSSACVKSIFSTTDNIEGVRKMSSVHLKTGAAIHEMIAKTETDYLLIYTKPSALILNQFALERMMLVAESTKAAMVYSNYSEEKEGEVKPHPVIDYQKGSLRDDFNFGSLWLIDARKLKKVISLVDTALQFAGLYSMRLTLSIQGNLVRVPEFLYTEKETDLRQSGQKIFDYVDPKNRAVQIEMEQVCTAHLKQINGYLAPNFQPVEFCSTSFEVEATVIIPVKNRVTTIEDAICSVLKQKANFNYNLIVVDNYSTDGTTELLKEYSKNDDRLIHVIPEAKDMGIGGCWNVAANHKKCGKFAVQLDSDDLYVDETTLQKVVNAFYEQQCAMVVGSYQMVNFKLEEIPPGLIDHREWTPENGRNNALRINGLGAPRAFFTPILRKNPLPNVSYGEDYALGLAISRNYQIGRIYDPIYLCRRWEDNSDAMLDVNKMNAHNFYKDWVRTVELEARINQNKAN